MVKPFVENGVKTSVAPVLRGIDKTNKFEQSLISYKYHVNNKNDA